MHHTADGRRFVHCISLLFNQTYVLFPTNFSILYPQNTFPIAINCRDRSWFVQVAPSSHRELPPSLHTHRDGGTMNLTVDSTFQPSDIWPLHSLLTPLSMLDPLTWRMNDLYNSFTIFCLIYLFHKIEMSLNHSSRKESWCESTSIAPCHTVQYIGTCAQYLCFLSLREVH